MSVEDVLEAMEAATAYEATSLDAPKGLERRRRGLDPRRRAGGRGRGRELVELSETLRGTLAALPARERLILSLRFERDLTQAEIAELRRRLADARLPPATAIARPALRRHDLIKGVGSTVPG